MPSLNTSNRRQSRAYTLIEVLVVVAIIGLAGAVVVPQMTSSSSFQIQAAGRMVIADILIAQNEAIAQQRPRRVIFDSTQNRYRITDENGNTLTANWRASSGSTGSNAYLTDFSADQRFRGVRIVDVNFGGDAELHFDDMGAPDSGGTVDLVANNLRYRISVAPFTGRVTIAPISGG